MVALARATACRSAGFKNEKLKYMNKDLKQESVVKSEILPADGKPKLSAVSFQFLYRKKPNQEFSQEFLSKKKTIIEAMDDFLSRKKNLYDIDEEIEVTYQDGKQEMIKVDARQDWDRSWYFVFENQMICGSGYACQYNGR